LYVTLNLFRNKLLGRPIPIGTTPVLPQGVHATIVVAWVTSPGTVPFQDRVVPSMYLGPITLHFKPRVKKLSHLKFLSVVVSTTPPLKEFRKMPKCSWVRF